MSSGSRPSSSNASMGNQDAPYTMPAMSSTASTFREEPPTQVVGAQRLPRRPVPAQVSGIENGRGEASHKGLPAQPSARVEPSPAGQRPKLSLRTGATVAMTSANLGNARSEIASSRRASEAAKSRRTSPIRTRDSAEQLTDRGHYDPEMETRAAAPWARPQDFTPVGPEQAFTPVSHMQEYFPAPISTSATTDQVVLEGLDTRLKSVAIEDPSAASARAAVAGTAKNSNGCGLERRPATKNRLYSAPPRLTERQMLQKRLPPPPLVPSVRVQQAQPSEPGSDTVPEASGGSNIRRKTLPRLDTSLQNVVTNHDVQFSPVVYQALTPPRQDSPGAESPKLMRRPKSSRSTTDAAKDSAAAKALSKGVGAVKTAVHMVTFGRRLSEANALHPDRKNSLVSPPPTRPGSGSSSRSRPRSRSTYQEPMGLAEYALSQPQAARKPEDEFTAREITDLSPASVEYLWRATCADKWVSEDQREAARVSFMARQQVAQMPEAQASVELTRRAIRGHAGPPDNDRSRQEATAREWVDREKNAAERLALRHPDRYPGLRRP